MTTNHTHNSNEHQNHPCGKAIFVKVATTSGVWPSQAEHYFRFPKSVTVLEVMKVAAQELGISDVSGWVAETEDKRLVTTDSFEQNHIHCDTIIDMHPAVGGGGIK